MAKVTSSSQQHKSMKTLKLNGFKREVAAILMMLTTTYFLAGEKNQHFLLGNKIGRMHAQHPKWNSQISTLVVTMIRKKVYSKYAQCDIA